MDTDICDDQNVSLNLNITERKKKCLTISEFNAMANYVDSLINNDDFVLNKFNFLTLKVLDKYPYLHENTVISIVDSRVQSYVRQRNYKVFNNTSNGNKRSTNSTSTMYNKYKELVANDSVIFPLATLSNNLRMPAMLVAKTVLSEQMNEEKLRLQSLSNEDSLNSDVLNDNSDVLTDISLPNDRSTQDKSTAIELNTSSNVDIQLTEKLKWLTKKILSMQKIFSDEMLNQSANSSTCSNSYPISTKRLNLTTHQLATSTWLIRSDPQLAYQVYICSIIDGYYGPCVEFIKSCTGKRYEQYLKQHITQMTTEAKSQTKKLDRNALYMTEKQCRLRGLDMTPDIVLNEPIAITLSDNDSNMKDNQELIAINYTGGTNKEVRVLNWIESKAMFGVPDHLRKAMQCQLFPYWNRYGPGAVIYWFGHILEDNEKDYGIHSGVSTNKLIIDSATAASVNISTKLNSTELSTSNFWSKYCLLMDGFPAANKIVMYNHKNNSRQNYIKKKNSTINATTV